MLDNGSIKITRYNGNDKIVDIPSEIDGHKVTEIGNSAFIFKPIEQINVPEGVTSIGSQTFLYCTNLTTVHLPSTVKELDDCVFAHSAVKDINLDAVESVKGDSLADTPWLGEQKKLSPSLP
ncbi:Leucine rich repeat-containing protein [Ruminococcaceae bacterium FB2012]|nr:Leucine rich repeat-containing protein [Ruminococcaceae bacterium FB2012]